MEQLGSILPLILLVVVFYFLLIRPQRKRQQEALKMQSNLTPGTRVMTTTGLFATVVVVDNEDVILEIAPGVETRWVKAAIGRVVTPGDPVADADDTVASTAGETADDSTDRPAAGEIGGKDDDTAERNDGHDTRKS
ncbi:preprotein translocase subunit YajC [Nonomuraea muscovyensis]|jgi:preprotein translocase subunit YajC|uniref:Preprotein translocase subunit YajC n=1 Tax=Nonomuraea muscovyensis TaxID=1124761 RepID=A0A7X0C568_9ACTN|nr:preprotein translocase subunit YajC [Nonomuraea muscovyensis]MBB6348607.1 preprotein translocase subunit YajC [Nonomuraea muscovyensis]MDF2709917.1 preprotein translocase subunit YajC [Nonomuraea muscovyensis]